MLQELKALNLFKDNNFNWYKDLDNTENFGHKAKNYEGEIEFNNQRLALIGLGNGLENSNEKYLEATAIRKALLNLYNSWPNNSIVDFGNLKSTLKKADSLAAAELCSRNLLQESLNTIYLGGTLNYAVPLYKSFKGFQKNMEVVYITPKIDLSENSVFSQILEHQPNYLFNFHTLAYQTYLSPTTFIEEYDKMDLDHCRLGLMRENIERSEAALRNSSLMIFDIQSIKQADAPGRSLVNPNGLSAEEACKLCWYAGHSDKIRSIALLNYDFDYDIRDQTAILMAQMLWHYLAGFFSRTNDLPLEHKEFTDYTCTIKGHRDLNFCKSERSDRWWLRIVHPNDAQTDDIFIPCTYKDYQDASKGDIPEIYFKALKRWLN